MCYICHRLGQAQYGPDVAVCNLHNHPVCEKHKKGCNEDGHGTRPMPDVQCFDVYYPDKPGARVASVYANACRVHEVCGGKNYTFILTYKTRDAIRSDIIARFRDVHVYDESGNEVTK